MTGPHIVSDWPAAIRDLPPSIPMDLHFEVKLPATPLHFDGATYEPERDRGRLNAQLARVKAAMAGAGPLTLRQISERTGDPEASVSARTRDLKKARFGGHTVRRTYVERGLFTYELLS